MKENPQLEIIGATKTRLFRFKTDVNIWPVYHYHPEFDVLCFPKNTGQYIHGDHVGNMYPGIVVINGPTIPHAYQGHEADEDDPDNPACLVLQFSIKSLEPLLQLPEMSSVRDFLGTASRGLELSGVTRATVAELMAAMINQNEVQRLAGFIQILDVLSSAPNGDRQRLASPAYNPTLNLENTQRIDKVTTHVRDNLHNSIRLEDAAKLIYMSPSSFSRFFKQQTGRTFVNYVNEMRIGVACRLLAHSDQPITDVAFEAGYNSLSNFNRRFQVVKGMTPTEFRAMHG